MRRDKAIKYFKLAKYQAELLSKDPCKKVGSLFLRPDTYEILTLGFNGMPRGIDETIIERWQKPIKYSYIEHSERNGIYNACRSGISLKDSICIVTFFPCTDCTRALIQVGVKTLVSVEPSKNSIKWKDEHIVSLEMLNEVNMELIFLTDEEVL
ncbi:MAG: deaminase [Candidatus Shapirobacteria bacterium]|nr:deaminase [Candidatus Shapirobacteria bacterium]